MTEWFTENALVPMIIGSCLFLCFAGLAFSFRDRTMLIVALLILVFTAGTGIVERLVVTDREQVEAIVRDLAVAVENNDVESVLRHVGQKRANTRARIRATASQYVVTSCRIVGFKAFRISKEEDPKTAVIEFVAFARGAQKSEAGEYPFQPQVTLTLEQEADGQWRVVDYAWSDPRSDVNL